MKVINNIQVYLIVPVLLLVYSSGCRKLIEVNTPNDWLDSRTIFSNDSLAKVAVNGLYSNIMGQTKVMLNGGMTLFGGLSADELKRNSIMSNEDQFTANELSTSNSLIHNNIWRAAYLYLYQCNIILEKLQSSEGPSDSVRLRLSAEVKFVRALCYTYLVNLFGDVPLALSSQAEVNAILGRSSSRDVYTQIKTDLQDAFNSLSDTVANTRPNKIACKALLARVFLYNEEWSDAESAASYVINSGRYQLVTDLDRVFKRESRETIFQWAPVINVLNSAEGNIFVPLPQATRPNYSLTTELLNAFEPGDSRMVTWVGTFQTSGYTYPHKYKVNASSSVTEYNVVLRLAEQYLIRAEARMKRENISGAVDDINLIRDRANLTGVSSAVTRNECDSILKQERRIELFAEWGHRWIDLKRWKIADAVLSKVSGKNWQSTDQLYPIPLSEIQRNGKLLQNQGY